MAIGRLTKPSRIDSADLVIGKIVQADIDRGTSVLTIDEDGEILKVRVQTELIKGQTRSDLEGNRVICATRHARSYDDPGPDFIDSVEIIHFLDGDRSGETLTYRYKN